MSDCLKLSVTLLYKLGSVIVHADPEVSAWLKQMGEMALIPRKRNIR